VGNPVAAQPARQGALVLPHAVQRRVQTWAQLPSLQKGLNLVPCPSGHRTSASGTAAQGQTRNLWRSLEYFYTVTAQCIQSTVS